MNYLKVGDRVFDGAAMSWAALLTNLLTISGGAEDRSSFCSLVDSDSHQVLGCFTSYISVLCIKFKALYLVTEAVYTFICKVFNSLITRDWIYHTF